MGIKSLCSWGTLAGLMIWSCFNPNSWVTLPMMVIGSVLWASFTTVHVYDYFTKKENEGVFVLLYVALVATSIIGILEEYFQHAALWVNATMGVILFLSIAHQIFFPETQKPDT